ncbi:MAG: Cna B-type domain-containing protein, partial [Clostridia bacterium]|nr:Cna B-type domain-containing protein [Clostridia bacterium]
TNTHEPEQTQVEGMKVWEDAENQDGIRPASITVNLLANGEKVDSQTVTADTEWKFSFTELDKFEDGVEIVYTVDEETVPAGYTKAVDGTTITNTHEPEQTKVEGMKVWEDAENQDGKRPESIRINLLAGGEVVDSKTVTAADDWKWSFTDLDKYEAGKEIIYTITEDAVDEYETTVDGYNVTNTHEVEKTEVTGTKTWVDQNDADGIRPESITVNLLADGEKVASQTVTEKDNWVYTFTDLDVNKAGKAIVYTIEEEPVEGYTTVIDGFNVTNTHTVLPKIHRVTVRYWYEEVGGEVAAPTFTKQYYTGQSYHVTSPRLPGYTADITLVKGVMQDRDLVFDVIYTAVDYTLTVEYIYENGTTAAPTHEETLKAGDLYHVVSPEIPNYRPSIKVVEGAMPARDVKVIVTYKTLGDYIYIDDYGKPLGLGAVNINAGDCFE